MISFFTISSEILYSKPVVRKLTKEALQRIHELSDKGVTPGLAVVLVGDDPASSIYVKNKEKFFLKNGCYSQTFRFKSSISQEDLVSFVEKLNADDKFYNFHKSEHRLGLPPNGATAGWSNTIRPWLRYHNVSWH